MTIDSLLGKNGIGQTRNKRNRSKPSDQELDAGMKINTMAAQNQKDSSKSEIDILDRLDISEESVKGNSLATETKKRESIRDIKQAKTKSSVAAKPKAKGKSNKRQKQH